MISREILVRLHELNESVKGTTEYTTYLMEECVKNNGRWLFVGYGLPYVDAPATIKKYKDTQYIMQGDRRYTISEAVAAVID